MKPIYVVLLMGAAALGGGLVVRYGDHPVEITLARPVPPAVVAPPVAPTANVEQPISLPVHVGPQQRDADTGEESSSQASRPKSTKPVKPSAFGEPARARQPSEGRPEPKSEPRPVARVIIPPDPPAITPLEHSRVGVPPQIAVTKPAPVAGKPASPDVNAASTAPYTEPLSPHQDEANHATLKAGMLITVRTNEALSSNVNAPGDVFSGRLEKPLIANGFVIAERGAHVRGEVVDSKSAGAGSELSLRLREILASDGQRVHLVTEPWRKQSPPSTGDDPGTRQSNTNVYDLALSRNGAALIRPGTRITFRLDQTLELTEKR
jgi:hypothetical protein